MRVDPAADSAIKSSGEFEAGFVFVEKGQEHVGIGNGRGAWAYCALNVPKNKKGYEDFNSGTPEPTHTWEYMRAGVPKFIAFKVEYVPGHDARITVWLNPDLSVGATEMNQPANIITRFEADATFDEIHLIHRGTGVGWKISQMVAGTSFDDLLLAHFWQRAWFIAVAGGGSLMGVAAVVQLLARRRARRRIRELEREGAVATERARIARDIHDELGASLTKIYKLAEMMDQDHAAAGARAVPKTIANTARDTIQTMDEIVWAVNPKNDTLSEMADYLVYFTEDFLRPTGIACVLDVALNLPAIPVAAEQRHNLFMVVKESLNNVVKHAAASKIRFGLDFAGDWLTVDIADNGRGFRPEEAKIMGNGLDNMRRRMAAIGGELILQNEPGKWTIVKLQVRLADDKTIAR
jgi:signal transduction histidine kinase